MFRIGVASIIQETNTFSPAPCTWDDFHSQGVFEGSAAEAAFRDTNTELGGALDEVAVSDTRRSRSSVPGRCPPAGSPPALWTSSRAGFRTRSPPVLLSTGSCSRSTEQWRPTRSTPVTWRCLRAARAALGDGPPIGICLDLHANVVEALVDEATFVLGYRTYPHIDMAETGARTARLLVSALTGEVAPRTRLAKRPMILPPESHGEDGPLGELRRLADARTVSTILDVGLFPVQPWLDVRELGFGVTVTSDRDDVEAQVVAEELASFAWEARERFRVELVDPAAAIARAREADVRPVLLSESADSPTAGTPADSPAVVEALLQPRHRPPCLRDPCRRARGRGVRRRRCRRRRAGRAWAARSSRASTSRSGWTGRVRVLGSDPFRLTGPFLQGSEVQHGPLRRSRHRAAVGAADGAAGLHFRPRDIPPCGPAPEEADVIHVRSANLFRAAWAPLMGSAFILDLPGASTPNLSLARVRARTEAPLPHRRVTEPTLGSPAPPRAEQGARVLRGRTRHRPLPRRARRPMGPRTGSARSPRSQSFSSRPEPTRRRASPRSATARFSTPGLGRLRQGGSDRSCTAASEASPGFS